MGDCSHFPTRLFFSQTVIKRIFGVYGQAYVSTKLYDIDGVVATIHGWQLWPLAWGNWIPRRSTFHVEGVSLAIVRFLPPDLSYKKQPTEVSLARMPSMTLQTWLERFVDRWGAVFSFFAHLSFCPSLFLLKKNRKKQTKSETLKAIS